MTSVNFPEKWTMQDTIELHNAYSAGQDAVKQWFKQYERGRTGRMTSLPKWLSAVDGWYASNGRMGLTALMIGTSSKTGEYNPSTQDLLFLTTRNTLGIKSLPAHDKLIIASHMIVSPIKAQQSLAKTFLSSLGIADATAWAKQNAFLFKCPLGLSVKEFELIKGSIAKAQAQTQTGSKGKALAQSRKSKRVARKTVAPVAPVAEKAE